MTERSYTPGPPVLHAIWIGMSVIDRDGALIGSVKFVREGDPSGSIVGNERPFAEETSTRPSPVL